MRNEAVIHDETSKTVQDHRWGQQTEIDQMKAILKWLDGS